MTTERLIDFSVSLTGKSPKNLMDSIRKVKNSSAGFVNSWIAGEHDEAYETSQEAFEHLDYVQSELIRQRDVHSKDATAWQTSALRIALDLPVGQIIERLSSSDSAWFAALGGGCGALPIPALPAFQQTLTLGKALNKLKHRHTIAVNFSITPLHTMYTITSAGMGQPETLVEVQILQFCQACASAAQHV